MGRGPVEGLEPHRAQGVSGGLVHDRHPNSRPRCRGTRRSVRRIGRAQVALLARRLVGRGTRPGAD